MLGKQPLTGDVTKGMWLGGAESGPWAGSTLQEVSGQLRVRIKVLSCQLQYGKKTGQGKGNSHSGPQGGEAPSAAGEMATLSQQEAHGEWFWNATQDCISILAPMRNMPLSLIPASYPTPTLHQDSLKFCSYKLFLPKCSSSFEKVLSKAPANKLEAPHERTLFLSLFNSVTPIPTGSTYVWIYTPVSETDWRGEPPPITLWSSPPSWISCWPDAGHTQPAANSFTRDLKYLGTCLLLRDGLSSVLACV